MTRTNLYTILCICIRLCAVYLFAQALIWTIDQAFITRREVSWIVWAYALSEPALGIVLALLLWMFPGPLARIAGDRRSMENFESDIAPDTLQYIALCILGVWFLITGLSQLAYTLHRWLFVGLYLKYELLNPTTDPKAYGSLLSEIVKAGLGAALALRARGIVAVLTRLRHAGLTPAVTETFEPQNLEKK